MRKNIYVKALNLFFTRFFWTEWSFIARCCACFISNCNGNIKKKMFKVTNSYALQWLLVFLKKLLCPNSCLSLISNSMYKKKSKKRIMGYFKPFSRHFNLCTFRKDSKIILISLTQNIWLARNKNKRFRSKSRRCFIIFYNVLVGKV